MQPTRWLRLALASFLLSVLVPVWVAAAPLRFAWLSDTHVGSQTAEADLRAAVNDINALPGLSFVVVSGDITEYGSREQLALAKSVLDGLKIPCHIIPGNHDTKWSESGATDFPRLWGADRFHFAKNGWHLVGLHQGPLMKMGDGHWAPQDVRWLERTLRRIGPEKPVIFVTHYPIDDGIANWYAVLDLLKRYNVQAVLCGHGHSNRKLSFEGIPGVMGRSNLRARNPAGGFNLVEIDGGRMTFSERVHGRSTAAPWHSLELGRPQAAPEGTRPRPAMTASEGVRTVWSRCTGFTIASTPAVQDGLAMVGDASGSFYAFDLASGRTRWRAKTGNAIYSTPAIAPASGKQPALVVFASTDGSVYALRLADGKRVWRHKTGRPVVASPAILDGNVFIGASDGKFRCLDARTGDLKWQFDGVKGFVETRPLLAGGKVIFGAWDQHLYALDQRTGDLAWKWRGDRPGDLLSPAACWPVAANGKVFVVAPDRQMTAIDLENGRQVWRTGDYVVRESIGISDDASRFYVRAMNDFVYAFATAPDRPAKIWERNAGFGYDINSAMLAEEEGTVFYGTKNSLLLALDAGDGALRWTCKTGAGVMNTVVPLGANRVLVTDFDGWVRLIEGPQPP